MHAHEAPPNAHHGARVKIAHFVVVDILHTVFIKASSLEHARALHYTLLKDAGHIISIAEIPHSVAAMMRVPEPPSTGCAPASTLTTSYPGADLVDIAHRGCGIVFRTPHVSTTRLSSPLLVTHPALPGDVLREYLANLGRSPTWLSIEHNLHGDEWAELLSGKRAITKRHADLFEKIFGRPAHFWLNLQSNFDAAQSP